MDRRAFIAAGLASTAAEPLAGLPFSPSAIPSASSPLPRIKVHPAGHLLQTEDGRPSSGSAIQRGSSSITPPVKKPATTSMREVFRVSP